MNALTLYVPEQCCVLRLHRSLVRSRCQIQFSVNSFTSFRFKLEIRFFQLAFPPLSGSGFFDLSDFYLALPMDWVYDLCPGHYDYGPMEVSRLATKTLIYISRAYLNKLLVRAGTIIN